ncbi:MAG: Ig-like domain-containing protein [Candidatus Margulisiibacteriota bacterium]
MNRLFGVLLFVVFLGNITQAAVVIPTLNFTYSVEDSGTKLWQEEAITFQRIEDGQGRSAIGPLQTLQTTPSGSYGVRTLSWVPQSALEDGVYRIKIALKDTIGNQDTIESDLFVDGTPPTLSSLRFAKAATNGIQAYALGDRNLQLFFNTSEVTSASITLKDSMGQVMALGQTQVTQNAQIWQYQADITLDTNWPDGVYTLEIGIQDEAGNESMVTSSITIVRTAPDIVETVTPLVVTSVQDDMVMVQVLANLPTSRQTESLNGTLLVMNDKNAVVTSRNLVLEAGQSSTQTLSLAGLPKGSYTVMIRVQDAYGNQNERRVAIVKDGSVPILSTPLDHEQINRGETVAIRGLVMDPDLTNGQPLQKFKLLFKAGEATNQLSDYAPNPALAVSARFRKGTFAQTGSSSEGNVEIRGVDSLGYLQTAGLAEGEYAVALVAQDGLETAFTTITLAVFGDVETATATGVGMLSWIQKPVTTNVAQSPLTFQAGVLNGGGNLTVDIVNKTSQQVVMSRTYSGLSSPDYMGVPDLYTDRGGTYIYKDPSSGQWGIAMRTNGSAQSFKVTVTPLKGQVTGVQTVNIPSNQLKTLGNGVVFEGTITTLGRVLFNLTETFSDPLLMVNVVMDGQEQNFLQTGDLYLGVGKNHPLMNPVMLSNQVQPIVTFSWDGKGLNGGYPNSGGYDAVLTLENPSSNAVVSTASAFSLQTPFALKAGTAKANLGDALGLPTLTIDPYSQSDVATVYVTASKKAVARAKVRDSQGAEVLTLADGLTVQPTTADGAYAFTWNGKNQDGLLAAAGNYVLNVNLRAEDGVGDKTITLPLTLKQTGASASQWDNWVSMDIKTETINGQPVPIVQGKTAVFWETQAKGNRYDPITGQVGVDLQNGWQNVTAYPYVPFVTVAHRWFETVNVNVTYELDIRYRHWERADGFFNTQGWIKNYNTIHRVMEKALSFKQNSQNKYTLVYPLEIPENFHFLSQSQDDINEPESIVLTVRVRTPDGKEIEKKTISDLSYYSRVTKRKYTKLLEPGRFDVDLIYVPKSAWDYQKYYSKINAMNIEPEVVGYYEDYVASEGWRNEIPNFKAGEKGAFVYKGGLERLDRDHYVFTADIQLEEDMKYSRLNNRFMPWFGIVNKTKKGSPLAAIDFSGFLEDPSQLGFPRTGFFEQPYDDYIKNLNKVIAYNVADIKNGSTDAITQLMTTPFQKWDEVSKLGSSYYNYLDDEKFELIVVNLSDPGKTGGWYTISPVPSPLAGSENIRSKAKYTVATDKVAEVQVPYPLDAELIATLNQRSDDAFNSSNSLKRLMLNRLLNQYEKALINRLTLSPELPNGQLSRVSEYWVEIPQGALSDGPGQFTFPFALNYPSANTQGEYKTTLVASALIPSLNAKLPANVDRSSYRLSVTALTVNSGPVSSNSLDAVFNGTEAVLPGTSLSSDLVVRISKPVWGQYWDSTQDPNLVSKEGKLQGLVMDIQVPLFNGKQKMDTVLVKSGYPPVSANLPGALFWKEGVNPNVEVTSWTPVKLFDETGGVHPDLSCDGVVGADPLWAGFTVSIASAKQKAFYTPFYAKQQLNPDWELSTRTQAAWEPIELISKPTGSRLGLWNVGRKNGWQDIRLKNGNTVALTRVMVGTPVRPAEAAVVKSPYGRVQVMIPAGTFAQDKLITVTPVALADLHITNSPDIQDLDFMPIVEILPETASANFNKTVTLKYQYTADEVKAIEAGTYPGLSKPVNLDNVAIYHISESGILTPAKATTGGRWSDLDGDGVLGSKGDLYTISAELDHFSIYASLEGLIPDQPKFSAETTKTAANTVTLYGYLEKNVTQDGRLMPLGLALYAGGLDQNNQIQLKPDQIQWLEGNPSYNLKLVNVPLQEGPNTFFLTYPTGNLKILNRPYAKISVVRDTTPPTFIQTQLQGNYVSGNTTVVFSPNGDGRGDEVRFSFYPSEAGTVRFLVADTAGKTMANTVLSVSDLSQPLTFRWNGCVDVAIPSRDVRPNLAVPEGRYTLYVTYLDEALNQSQAQFGVVVDQTPPTVSVKAPAFWSYADPESLVPWTLVFSDNAALSRAQLRLMAAGQQVASLSIPLQSGEALQPTITISVDAVHYLLDALPKTYVGPVTASLWTRDMAGNSSAVSVNVMVDHEAPTVVKKWALGKLWEGKTITINQSLAEKGVTFGVAAWDNRVSSANLDIQWQVETKTETMSIGTGSRLNVPFSIWQNLHPEDGEVRVSARISDGYLSTMATFNVALVMNPPQLVTANVVSPKFSPKAKTFSSLDLGFSAPVTGRLVLTNAAGKSVWETGVSGNRWVQVWPLSGAPDGGYTWTLTFQDVYRNTGTPWTSTVIQDQLPPTILIPFENAVFAALPTENLASVIKVTDNVSTTLNTQITFLANGAVLKQPLIEDAKVNQIFYLVTATDKAGNTQTAQGSFLFDREAPVISLPETLGVTSNTLKITPKIWDQSPVRVTLIPTKGSPQSVTVNPTQEIPMTLDVSDWPEGTTVLAIQAVDRFGHTSTGSVKVLLDRAPPVITRITLSPRPLFLEPGIATVSIQATDASGSPLIYKIALPTFEWETITTNPVVAVPVGLVMGQRTKADSVALRVTVTDAAGWSVSTQNTLPVIQSLPAPVWQIGDRYGSVAKPITVTVNVSALAAVVSQDVRLKISLVNDEKPVVTVFDDRLNQTQWAFSLKPTAAWADGAGYTLKTEVWVSDVLRGTFYQAQPAFPNQYLVIQNQPLAIADSTLSRTLAGRNTPVKLTLQNTIEWTDVQLQFQPASGSPVALGAWESGTALTFPNNLPDGVGQVVVAALSKSGIKSSLSLPLTWDSTPPELTHPETVAFKAYDQGQTDLVFRSSEPLSLLNVKVIGADNKPVEAWIPEIAWNNRHDTATVTWTGRKSPSVYLPEGTYKVVATATDLADNTSTATVTLSQINDFPNLWIDATAEAMNPQTGSLTLYLRLNTDYDALSLKLTDSQRGTVARTLVPSKPMKAGVYTLTFDGKDDSGVPLKDGIYDWVAEANKAGIAEPVTNKKRLIIKTRGPVFYPTLSRTQLRKDRFPITIQNIDIDPAWVFGIALLDAQGKTLDTLYEKPRYQSVNKSALTLTDLMGSGKTDRLDGSYKIQLYAVDEAQNRAQSVFDIDYKLAVKGTATIHSEKPFFTPNGDGILEVLNASVGVDSTESQVDVQVRVETEGGKVLVPALAKTKLQRGQSLPVTWGGYDVNRMAQPDGLYALVAEVTAEDGGLLESKRYPFAMIAQKPVLSLASPIAYSPNLGTITLNAQVVASDVLFRADFLSTELKLNGTVTVGGVKKILLTDGFDLKNRTSTALVLSPAWANDLPDGTYPVTIRMEDSILNVFETTPVQVVVSRSGPVTPSMALAGPQVTSQSVAVLMVSAPGAKTVRLMNTVGQIQTLAVSGNVATATVSLTEGTNTFKATALNTLGNASATGNAVTVLLDRISPTVVSASVSSTLLGANQTATASVTFSKPVWVPGGGLVVKGVDMASPSVSVQELLSPTLSVTHRFSLSSPSLNLAGTLSLSLSGVVDQAGNPLQTEIKSVGDVTIGYLMIDTLPPATPSVSAPALVTTSILTLAVADEAGSVLSLSLNGQNVPIQTLPIASGKQVTITGLVEGNNTLQFRSTDAMGNTSDWSPTVSVVMDTTPPVLSLLSAAAGWVSTGYQQVVVTANEALKTVSATFNGTPMTAFGSGVFGIDIRATENQGTASIQFTAQDLAGNTSILAATPFAVDTVPPELNLLPITQQTVSSGSIQVTVNASETLATASVTFNGTPMTSLGAGVYTYAISNSEPQGALTVVVHSKDLAGNESTLTTAPYSVDTIAPSLNAVLNLPSRISTGPIQVTINANESLASLKATLNGTAMTVSGNTLSTTLLQTAHQGPATLVVLAKDKVGNGTELTLIPFEIDTIAPILTLKNTNPAWVKAGTITLGVSVNELIASQSARLNGHPMTPVGEGLWTYTITSSDAQGVATFTATLTDRAGNTSTLTEIPFSIDTVPPSVPQVVTFSPQSNQAQVSVTLLGDVGSELWVSQNGQVASTQVLLTGQAQPWTSLPLKAGENQLSFASRDLAGNQSEWSVPIIITQRFDPAVLQTYRFSANPASVGLWQGTLVFSEPVTVLSAGWTLNQLETPCSLTVSGNTVTVSAAITAGMNGTALLQLSSVQNQAGVTTSVQLPFVIDTTPPKAVTISGIRTVSTGDVVVTLNINEGVSANATFNGHPMTTQSTADNTVRWSYTIGQDEVQGTANIIVTLVDAAGNSAVVTMNTVVVDTVQPQILAMNWNKPISSLGSIEVRVTFSEAVVSPKFTVNGKTIPGVQTGSSSFQLSVPIVGDEVQGMATITTMAKDAAGNGLNDSRQAWVVDTLAPTVSVQADPFRTVGLGWVQVTINASENISTPTVSINGHPMSAVGGGVFGYVVSSADAQGTANFEVRAKDLAGNATVVQISPFVVDTVGPKLSLSPSDSVLVGLGSVTVTVNASETLSSLRASINHQPMTAVGQGVFRYTITPADTQGTADIEVEAVDEVGNQSSVTASVFVVDTVAPSLNLVSMLPNRISTGPIQVMINANEPLLTLTATLNSKAMTVSGNTLSTTILQTEQQGPATLVVSAQDTVGNGTELTLSPFEIDTIAPVLTLQPAAAEAVSTGAIRFEVTVNEPLATVNATLNGKPLEVTIVDSGSIELAGTITAEDNQGLAQLMLLASDTVGNQTVVTATPIRIDTEKPILTLSTPSGRLSTGNVVVTVSANETLSRLSAMLNGFPMSVSGNSLAFTITSTAFQGPATLVVSAQDSVGNGTEETLIPFEIDTIAPTLTLSTNAPAFVSTGPVTVTLTANEALSSQTLWLNNRPMTASGDVFTTIIEATDAQGPAVLLATGIDLAGNTTSQTETLFEIDTLAPTLKLSSEVFQTVSTGTITLTVTTDETLATLNATFNDSPMQALPGGGFQTLILPTAQQGTASVTITATDRAGNTTQLTPVLYGIDTQPPTASIADFPAFISTRAATLQVSAIADASFPVQLEWSLNGGVWQEGPLVQEPGSAAQNVTFATEGTQTLKLRLRDRLGNVSETNTRETITDFTPPQVVSVTVLDSAGQPDPEPLYRSDKTILVTFSEPISSTLATASFGTIALPIQQITTSAVQITITEAQLVGSSAVFELAGIQDQAGNAMAPYAKTYALDLVPPDLKTVTLNTDALPDPTALSQFNTQGLKIAQGYLTAALSFSKPVMNPKVFVAVQGIRKEATWMTVTPNAVSTAEFKVLIKAADLGFLANPNEVDATLEIENARDVAGNLLSPQSLPIVLDMEAPVVTNHGADNGITVDKNDLYYGVIKPYGVSGQQDQLRVWFTLSEPALVSAIQIVQVSPNVLVKTLTNPTKTGPNGDEYSFVWDGKDETGKLVGNAKSQYFYYVTVTAKDKAGNLANQNIDGYISVLHQDTGVRLSSPLPVEPKAPGLDQTVPINYMFSFVDERIRTSADFKALYPNKDFKPFALPSWGTYELRIYPEGQPNQPVLTKQATITAMFSPVSTVWDGRYAADHSVVALRGTLVPDGVYRVEIRATDNAGNGATQNVVANNQMVIDNTPPTITQFALGSAYTNALSIAHTKIAQDNTDSPAQLNFYANGVLVTGPTLPLQAIQGTQTITLQAKDRAGNTSAVATASVVYDSIAPSASILWQNGLASTLPATDREVSTNVAFSVTISEVNLNAVQVAVNGAMVVSANGLYSVNTTGINGTFPVVVTVSDLAGNTTLLNKSLWVDSLAPTVSVSNLAGFMKANSATLNLSGLSDASLPLTLERALNGGSFTVIQTLNSLSPISDGVTFSNEGTQQIAYRLRDRLGNQSETLIRTTVFDATPPTLGADKITGLWTKTAIGAITLSASDALSGLVSAHYRWDNADAANGTTFVASQSITLPAEGSHTLYLTAIDMAGNTQTWSGTYLQDTQTPTVNANKAQAGWSVSPIGSITLTASDPVPGSGLNPNFVMYRWDNSDVVNGSLFSNGQVLSSPGEGSHTLYLKVQDIAGNSTTLWSGSYNQDTQAPVATATQSSSSWQTTAIGNITLSATDALPGSGITTAKYRWDNADVANGTAFVSGQTMTMPAEGSHTLYIQSWDVAGNAGSVWTGTYKQDTQPPVATADKSSGTWKTTAIGNITLTVSDPQPGSGISTSKYRWDNPDVANGTTFVSGQTITIPAEGSHTLYVQSWDVAGNAGAVWTGTYKQDTQAPSGSADKSSLSWSTTALGTITLNTSDPSPGSGVGTAKYRWDNSDVSNGTPYSSGQTTVIPSEGSHTLYIQVWDLAGNAGVVWSGLYKQDTATPQTSANLSNSGWYLFSLGTITLTATDGVPGSGLDPVRTKYRWDNVLVDSGTSFANGTGITVPGEGRHTLYLKAYDTAGNVSGLWTGDYNIDTVPPVVLADKSSSQWSVVPIGTITLSVSDAAPGSGLSGAKYRWDNVAVANGTSFSTGQTLTIPGEGAHTLYLQAWDAAGNASTVWSGPYQQDTQVPVVSANKVQLGWYTTAIGNITLTATDPTPGSGLNPGYVKYRWDNPDVSNGTVFANGQTTAIPSEGTHTLYLQAWDQAFNPSTVWNAVYAQDTQAPVVSAAGSSDQWRTALSGIVVSMTDDGNSGWAYRQYRWNNGPWTDWASGAIPIPGDGDHILALRAGDIATNTGTWQGTYRFDSTAPVIDQVQVTPTVNPVYDGNMVIHFRVSDNLIASMPVQVKIKRQDGSVVKTLLLGQKLNGEVSDVLWDLKTIEGYSPLEGTYNAEIVVSDNVFTTSKTISFRLTYQQDVANYTVAADPVLFRKINNKQWAVVPSDAKVDIALSDDGLSWSPRYSCVTAGKALDVQSDIGPNGGVVVYVLQSDSAQRTKISLPVDYEGFRTRITTLLPGFRLDTYSFTRTGDNRSMTFYAHPMSTRVMLNKQFWLRAEDFDFPTNGQYGAIVKGFIRAPRGQGGLKQFYVSHIGGCRLWINGTLVHSRPEAKEEAVMKKVNMEEEVSYPFILWTDNWDTGGHMDWTFTDVDNSFIPANWFYQDTTEQQSMNEALMSSWMRGIRNVNFEKLLTNSNSRLSYTSFLDDINFYSSTNGGGRGNLASNDWSEYYHFYYFSPQSITPQEHNFLIESDDDETVKVNGTVISAISSHVPGPVPLTIPLQKGLNEMWILHYQSTGPAYLYFKKYLENGTTKVVSKIDTPVYVRLDGEISNGIYATVLPGTTLLGVSSNTTIEVGLDLVSPKNNPTLQTNKPTFTWQVPTYNPALQYRIELKQNWVEPMDSTPFASEDRSQKWDLLPSQIQRTNTTLAFTPLWTDTLAPGWWQWQVVELNPSLNSQAVSSEAGGFYVAPKLQIEGVINYPNPFKDSTKIRYKLSKSVNRLRIQIFTLGGDLIRELEGDTSASSLLAEYHDVSWNGKDSDGRGVLNGVYLYKIIAEGDGETQEVRSKLIKLK